MDRFAVKLANDRIQRDLSEQEDILKYMLQDLRSDAPKAFVNPTVLYSDVPAILIGRTDTVSCTLGYAFYELARDAHKRNLLREAIAPMYSTAVPYGFASRDLEHVQYLTGFMNEVWRMYNPTCSNGLRTVPPEGIQIDDVPDDFIPERWMSRPELVIDEGAFHPFLIRPYNCAGKQIALTVVRLVLAYTVWNYDFEFGPGETGVEIHEKALNQLILKPGPLYRLRRGRRKRLMLNRRRDEREEEKHYTLPYIEMDSTELKFKPGLRFRAAFGSLCVLFFATALDAMTLAPALPAISNELHGTALQAFWTGTSFLLASTASQLTFGALSQSFGRKYLILLAVSLFFIGSILTASAESIAVLLLGRTIQGLGGGGIVTLVEITITDLVPSRHRGSWFGYQSAVSAVGTAAGPIVGGGFVDSIGWRWVFWINLPLCAIGFTAILAFLRLHKVPGAFVTNIIAFDWMGVVLLTASLTAFLVSISWGGVMFPWSSWQTLVPLILGILGIPLFIIYERNVPNDPIVRLSIFRRRSAMVNYLGTVIHGIVTWCLVYYIALYYQCVLGFSATIAGVATLPETLSIAPTSILAGVLISKWARFRWAVWTGWSLSALGLGLLYLLGPATPRWEWVILNIIPGLGIGLLYNSLAYATISAAEEKDAAYAASMYIFSRALGQSIGVAAGGAILQSQLEIKLQDYAELRDQASSLASMATSLVGYVKTLPNDSPERAMIVEAYSRSLGVIWATTSGLALFALLASLFTEPININKPLETEQGFKNTDGSTEKAADIRVVP
ncbi:hypothetical protein E0Z10_g5158 [Xylaria hypoxylon]|uniref:Major facilitator superfamily (MFS) profile domain-containing protein n=1 Tax=Xylaria hypoxylon TaxID=37992 RepID=A0A4Z0YJD8_9PEZI|nr:hypothetical protein E0Z10_g5158 [Xylaria hypoxylon]